MKYVLDKRNINIEVNSIFEEDIQSFFDSYIPSSKIQHLLIQNKWIKLDGNNVKRDTKLNGNILSINIYPYDNNYLKYDYKLDVIYEDEFIIVINKPKDILVHSDGNDEITLTDYVKSYYSNTPYIEVTPIHRLDKETSGLVLFSKTKIFQPLFDQLLKQKKIRREYLAFVDGNFEEESMILNYHIGKDRHNSKRRIVHDNGQEAITKVKRISSKNNVSILRCTLDTGRTHQIRVHLAHIGYPILNDSLYGVKSNKIIRMGLVADEMSLYHPIKDEMINIEINLPNDVSKLYEEVTR